MHTINRRQFGLSLAGTAAAGVLRPNLAFAMEPPPEIKTIRLQKSPVICFAPHLVMEAFIKAEGFDGIEYVDTNGGLNGAQMVARHEIDISTSFAGTVVH